MMSGNGSSSALLEHEHLTRTSTHGREFMRQISRHTALGIMALVAGIAVVGGDAAWRAARAQAITDIDDIDAIDAHVIATNIPGASAIAQVGTFLNVPPPGACANPIPS